MKNKLRYITTLLAVVLCMTAFSIPAFAGGGDPGDEHSEDIHQEEQQENTQTVTVNVVENADGSRTVTIGDQTWNLDSEQKQTGKVVNVNSYLHLRTGPSTDYSIIGHLLNGTEVEVIRETGGWYEIVVPEQTGYVCGEYLKVLNTPSESDTNSMNGLLEILLQYFSTEESASTAPLTPDGNLTLVDDISFTTGAGKQFVTVQSKAGNTFYLIIDRDDDGTENVHFLNLVDEADLMALTEDGEAIVPSCICTDKCSVGAINTNCPVCRTNMTECKGKEVVKEPEAEPVEPVDDPPEKSSGGSGIIVGILLLVLGGGGALYWFKFRKSKADTKGNDDLDDYDYGEDEDYEYETEEDVTTEEDKTE